MGKDRKSERNIKSWIGIVEKSISGGDSDA